MVQLNIVPRIAIRKERCRLKTINFYEVGILVPGTPLLHMKYLFFILSVIVVPWEWDRGQ